jgi:hypothetical protein
MRALLVVVALLISACTKEPIEWAEIAYTDVPPQPSELPSSLEMPPSRTTCPGSLRIAKAGTEEYAAWWQSRADSSAVLMTSRRTDRAAWTHPVIADSTDHGVRGCGRPAPAIAADSGSGYIHIAYFAEPASGAGVFFAHSMDKGETFHAAVPIVFGKNPARVGVAADGDRVAVAYEDPNSSRSMIGIALSNTMGHIFESRSIATSENGRARQPVVGLAGDSVRLWWSEYSPDPTVSATRPMYRAGAWRN